MALLCPETSHSLAPKLYHPACLVPHMMKTGVIFGLGNITIAIHTFHFANEESCILLQVGVSTRGLKYSFSDTQCITPSNTLCSHHIHFKLSKGFFSLIKEALLILTIYVLILTIHMYIYNLTLLTLHIYICITSLGEFSLLYQS